MKSIFSVRRLAQLSDCGPFFSPANRVGCLRAEETAAPAAAPAPAVVWTEPCSLPEEEQLGRRVVAGFDADARAAHRMVARGAVRHVHSLVAFIRASAMKYQGRNGGTYADTFNGAKDPHSGISTEVAGAF